MCTAAAEGAPEQGEGVVVEQGHLRPQQQSLQSSASLQTRARL